MLSRRARVALLFAWAAALPIHPLPFRLPGTLGRLGAGEWLFPLALVVVLASLSEIRSRARELRGGLAPLFVVALGMLPSVLVATDTKRAVVQWAVLAYVAAIFAIGRTLTTLDRSAARVLLGGLVAGVFVRIACGFIAPAFEPWMPALWPRPLGFAESPNMLALQAGSAAIALVRLGLRRSFTLAGIAICVVTIVAVLGHVLVAALVAAAFVVHRVLRERGSKAAPFGLAGLVLATCLLAASMRVHLLPVRAAAPFVDVHPNMYAAAHEIALETFAAHPVAGVGLDGFEDAWRERDDGTRYADRAPPGCVGCKVFTPIEPHSTWLGYLAEGGVFGVAAVAALTVLAVRVARSRKDKTLDLAFVFVGACSVMADMLTNRELALVIGVLLGGHSFASPRAKIDAT